MESKIVLQDIEKAYGKDAPVIENLNLEIKEGSFTVLLGPSGCGKSTTLRMIAGLEQETRGTLSIGGKDMKEVKPGDRGIAMVFQNYALYPTMTVKENIEFGLKDCKVSKAEREERVREVSMSVGLEEYLNRKPNALSGGQRQRVALAMSMGTHIVLMHKGKIMQQGSPYKIYHDPDNVFTAQFIGTPPMNVLEMAQGLNIENCPFSNAAYAGFRPEYVRLLQGQQTEESGLSIKGEVITHEMLGTETLYKIDTPFGRIQAKNGTTLNIPVKPVVKTREFAVGSNTLVRRLLPYLMGAPAIAASLIFLIYPIIYMFRLSFYKWNMVGEMKFIGLDNYIDLFSDPEFMQVLLNTCQFTFWTVAGSIVLGLVLAVYLRKNKSRNSCKKLLLFAGNYDINITCQDFGLYP